MSTPGSLRQNPELDSWLRIDAGAATVTVFSGKVELGQGIVTALTLIAAEELELSVERIRVVTADSGRGPNEYYTAGSQSIEDSGTALRHAAAHARQVLLELAAASLGAGVEALELDDGVIRVARSEPGVTAPSTTYWTLMGGKRFARRVDVSVATRAPERYRLVGKGRQARVDLPAKVFGQPVFVQDLVLPGMLHGRVVRPPDPRARLLSIDLDSLEGRDGIVRVVRDGSFLGVVAEREDQAVAAAARLMARARWEVPAQDRRPPSFRVPIRSAICARTSSAACRFATAWPWMRRCRRSSLRPPSDGSPRATTARTSAMPRSGRRPRSR